MEHEGVFASLLGQLATEHQRLLNECVSLRAKVHALRNPTNKQPEQSRVENAPGKSTEVPTEIDQDQLEVEVEPEVSSPGASEQPNFEIALWFHVNEPQNQLKESTPSLSAQAPLRQSSSRSEGAFDHKVQQQNSQTDLPDLKKRFRSKRSATFSGTLSGTAPQLDLELWPVWKQPETLATAPFSSLTMSMSTTSMLLVKAGRNTARGGDTMRDEDSCLQHFVMGPNSRWRLFWDSLSVIAVGYDVLTVPLIAFGPIESAALKVIGLITTIFWSLDIPFTFMTGFHLGGVVEMRPKIIAKHYFQRWFLLDFFIILTDWALLIAQSEFADIIGVVRISKTLRLWRLLRLIRLLRIVKLPSLSDDIAENLQSETLVTILGVLRSMAIIAIVNHFIACGWYGVGQITTPTWLVSVADRDFGYRYTTSFHWSLTQFTPASMEVSPKNTIERIYAIGVLFSALVTFSTFISSITSAMTTLRRINLERSKEREAIRRYIAEKKVSVELGNRITAFLRRHNFMAKKRVHEEDIQVFKVLPETLRLQLHWEVYIPTLLPHPFFHHLCEVDEKTVLDVCHHAMAEHYLGTSQELFTSGKECIKMFFTLQGVMEYSVGMTREAAPVELSEDMPSRWFCEPCLWVKWEHRGSLTAVTPCEFATLQARKFHKIVCTRLDVLGACQIYAQRFLEKMLERGLDKVTDLLCEFDEVQEAAQQAFENVEQEIENSPHRSGRGKKLNRPWRSWSPSIFKNVHTNWRCRARRSNSA